MLNTAVLDRRLDAITRFLEECFRKLAPSAERKIQFHMCYSKNSLTLEFCTRLFVV